MQVTNERTLRDVLAALSVENQRELVKDPDNPELTRHLDPETRDRWNVMPPQSKVIYLAKVLEEAGSTALGAELRKLAPRERPT
jgi:hypothetical protein